jgi:hypothetical protein
MVVVILKLHLSLAEIKKIVLKQAKKRMIGACRRKMEPPEYPGPAFETVYLLVLFNV